MVRASTGVKVSKWVGRCVQRGMVSYNCECGCRKNITQVPGVPSNCIWAAHRFRGDVEAVESSDHGIEISERIRCHELAAILLGNAAKVWAEHFHLAAK